MTDIVLEPNDPTIWAKCPQCTKSYLGAKVGNYFAKAYPRKKAGRSAEDVISGQVCENCGTPMQFLYEVK